MDLTLTTLVHQVCGMSTARRCCLYVRTLIVRNDRIADKQKGSRPVEAVVGFIDRMDEAEQELVRASSCLLIDWWWLFLSTDQATDAD